MSVTKFYNVTLSLVAKYIAVTVMLNHITKNVS